MNQNDKQELSPIKGRPMLQWLGKKPLQAIEYFPAQEKEVYGDVNAKEFNKLFWGDNLQVLSHLLKEYRGKVDLVYIDPPFDSKADYVKKIKLRGVKLEGNNQSIVEEKQYTDIWENDEYLQFMYIRFQLVHELLSDTGSLYVHADYRKVSHLRLILDEIFGNENFQNEIIWENQGSWVEPENNFPKRHNNILYYSKTKNKIFNQDYENDATTQSIYNRWYRYIENNKIFAKNAPFDDGKFIPYVKNFEKKYGRKPEGNDVILDFKGSVMGSVWYIKVINPISPERTDYPTQKPEELLERIVKASSNVGDIVLDCFCGSGTTMAVAQKLGRSWLGCDINLGAIQTATKRLSQIIQQKSDQSEIIKKEVIGNTAFKVLNVNEYDVFNNELEAKNIVMNIYGIEPIKRSFFDGEIDNKVVKIMPLNRVLNKLDIVEIFKNIESQIDQFTVKKTSKTGESVYEEGVLIIASGIESNVRDFIKKENKTGVEIEVRDIQSDKKTLIFKKPCEAKIEVAVDKSKASVQVKDFYSPILIQKLELENAKRLKKEDQVVVEDYRQIIDSICIDINYDGKLFNAEIMDLPNNKKEMVKGKYEFEYKAKGKQTIAVKIIDVLGEEYFETFRIEAK